MNDKGNSPLYNEAGSEIEDANVAAFLVLQGHVAIPWRDAENNAHIVFHFDSDIKRDVESFYKEETMVSIKKYVQCFKMIKSEMYAMKSMERKV